MCVEGPFYKENCEIRKDKDGKGRAEESRVREKSICVQECVCEKTEHTCARESVWERKRVCACVCLSCMGGVGALCVYVCMSTCMCAHV